MQIQKLWDHTLGDGIRIAILDTGITPNHPDLQHAIKESRCRDFTGSVYGARDIRGHGTHCAGLIAGRHTSNRKIGLAPASELIVAKVLPDRRPAQETDFLSAVDWCLEQGADVFSMSLGNQTETPVLREAVDRAIQAGKFVFCAAGNDYRNKVDFPAAYPETIAVGSVGLSRLRSRFSSIGEEVDVVAPGEGILSTYPPYGYRYLNGTSVATAYAAGLGALMVSQHRNKPGETPIEDALSPDGNQQRLKEHLARTAIDLGARGHDRFFGHGMISLEAAFE